MMTDYIITVVRRRDSDGRALYTCERGKQDSPGGYMVPSTVSTYCDQTEDVAKHVLIDWGLNADAALQLIRTAESCGMGVA